VADYDHGRIININADGDRATTLSIGVFQGNASLVVFSNKQSVARFPLARAALTKIKMVLIELIPAPPGSKKSYPFTKYDMDTKKSIDLGSLTVGKDDKGLIYFGIQVPHHPAMKFILKSPLAFDSSEPMSDMEKSILETHATIDKLTHDFPMALQLTSFKRDPNIRSGGSSARSTTGDIF
jgi:hypothetical protein